MVIEAEQDKRLIVTQLVAGSSPVDHPMSGNVKLSILIIIIIAIAFSPWYV